ncbi:serine/threonine-protein kinase [Actinomadura oligospora]|uniref:serine/threonine-protein kinase n=1 Tax=Actinomadura oligospora TaxID=111804 RepID=UPI0004BA4D05|nr:serine/threonine-protein kinase [Actinomadura oligospora]
MTVPNPRSPMGPLLPADPERLGAHRLVGRLGAGGQGVVYLGEGPDGPVAIKLLHERLLDDAPARARFLRELALLPRVAGFCTARFLGTGEHGDRPYLVSEYVPGPSLRELVDAHGPRRGTDLDRLAVSSITALAAIHRAGIVHRDLNPRNILVGPDGPRVIDFGVARALDGTTPAITGPTPVSPGRGLPLSGALVGTPAYMAPEQFAGGAVGPAADLFCWAATLLFAATGADPFGSGPTTAVIYKILCETPDLSALPPHLAAPAAACLSKDVASRPTAEAVLLGLLGTPAPTVASAPAAPQAPAAEPEEKRRRSRALVAGLGLASVQAAGDVVGLAAFVAQPTLSAGRAGPLLVAVAVSFAVLAVVTFVAIVPAWRGARDAIWTVAAVRIARVVLWAAWSVHVSVPPPSLITQAALSALVAVLLVWGVPDRR